jgi:uncharacterized protein (TIGR02466 family)
MKNCLGIFPIPVKQIMLDSISKDSVSNIIHAIDQEKLENNQLIKNGYRSKTNTFLDRNLWLKEIFQKEINCFLEECGIIPARVSYSWCNKYINKGVITPHKHELSIISGVYYPLIKGENSFLKIRNPCAPFKVNEISIKTTKFNEQEFSIPIQENMLILFPSWIEHYSENESEIKYAISFDTEIIKCPG